MCTTRVHTALSTYSHSLVSSHVWLLYVHIVCFHHMYGCYIRTLSGFITILTLYCFIKCKLIYTHIVWFHQMYCCYILTLFGFIKCMVALYSHCLVSSLYSHCLVLSLYLHCLVLSNVWLLYTHIVWFHQMYCCYILT